MFNKLIATWKRSGILLWLLSCHGYVLSEESFNSKRFSPNFGDAMGFDTLAPRDGINFSINNHPILQLCQELYERNNMGNVEPTVNPIIPKIVHVIWLGPNTPPPVFTDCIESIKKYLPQWKCKIWTDADISDLSLINKKYYDEETNYGAKADILRYELLYRFGGLYIDVDIVLKQPLDILNHTYEFYTGLFLNERSPYIVNGLIASIPGHPILKECIDTIKDSREFYWVVARTGPIHFEKAFCKMVQKNNFKRVIALPASFFYPFDMDWKMRSAEERSRYIKDETFAIHYWAGSWWD